jgi:hypothetical protein
MWVQRHVALTLLFYIREEEVAAREDTFYKSPKRGRSLLAVFQAISMLKTSKK